MTALADARVLITTDAVGGVWTYSTNLALGLAAQGAHVCLLVLGPPPSGDQLACLGRGTAVEVELTDFALEWMDPDGRDMARARRGLIAAERCLRPDLVHLNGYREAAYGWSAPILIAAHSCVWTWWRACRGEDPL